MKDRERRKSQRYWMGYPQCQIHPGLEGFSLFKDISVNGALVVGEDLPLVGSIVELWLDRNQPRAVGRVVRHKRRGDRGFAVEFMGPGVKFLKNSLKHRPTY